ncbi:Ig-like domain-containing protein [Catenovulum sediminis]|uniref:Ig-like domain-containing protein n=1 Tax=Catenovulum sediminis TaxID=1740262 RepID=A0ABV1RCZ0_9ALTE
MKSNLLNKSIIAVTISFALTACGTDEGYNLNFGSSEKVEFSDEAVNATFKEDSGVQSVNLLSGATVNGKPLNEIEDTVFVRSFVFENSNEAMPPQQDGNAPNQDISPFFVDGTQLRVNTDAFSELFQKCPVDAAIKTGFTYTVDYVVDNGFDYPIGETPETRRLNLTIEGIADPVTGLTVRDQQAGDVTITVAQGGQADTNAKPTPAYACDTTFSYQSQDTSIVTVDDSGVLTGVAQGNTRVTVTVMGKDADGNDVSFSGDVAVEVIPAPLNVASMSIENGETVGEIPTCTTTAFNIVPQAEAGKQLAGTFVYAWQSTGANLDLLSQRQTADFSETAYFRTSELDADNSDNAITVSLATVDDATTTFNVVENLACGSKGNYSIDLSFDNNADLNANIKWAQVGAFGQTTTVNDSVSGNAYMYELTSDPSGAEIGLWYQNFNAGAGSNSFFAAHFGLTSAMASGGSHGIEVKTGVWVKVIRQDNNDTSPVTIKHTLLPWTATPGGDRGPKRALSPEFVGTVTPGAWTYVEFVDQLWDNDESTVATSFIIPNTWVHRDGDAKNVSVIPEFLFEGLSVNDKILLDDYSIIQLN